LILLKKNYDSLGVAHCYSLSSRKSKLLPLLTTDSEKKFVFDHLSIDDHIEIEQKSFETLYKNS